MWDDKKSLYLSKVFLFLFISGLIGVIVTAPWLTRWFLDFSRAGLKGTRPFFLATIYGGAIPAGALYYNLLSLLKRIEKEEVFIRKNVDSLRRISWSCFAGALIALVSTFYYFPWIFMAIAAAFMGLIVRIVKNVIAKAVALKDEVDYTV